MKIINFDIITSNLKSISFSAKEKKEQLQNNDYAKINYDKFGLYTSVIDQNKQTILKKLENIEKENNIKIIYAGEQGSRAWGSDSTTSDYDVRYIYVSPKSKYLNNPKNDFITNELNETYDICGLDLSKVVKMLKKGDRTPYEILNSSVKYKESNDSKELGEIINNSCDISKIKEHYILLGESIYNNKIKNNIEDVNLKLYLLSLKFVLSADYIEKTNSLPPLKFKELFSEGLEDEPEVYNISRNLLSLKRKSNEDITVNRIPVLDKFIEKKIYELKAKDDGIVTSKTDFSDIDNYFEKTINSPKFKDINKLKFSDCEQERLNRFPKDIDYKKELITNAGQPKDEFLSVQSIVGPEELKYILNRFNNNPEAYSNGEYFDEKIGKPMMKNVIERNYRANLHIHTNHSDGEMSVEELLNSSVKYANQIENYFSNKGINDFEPFTIAITDHNSVNGCKEAVKIISSNPEKYKNLRVILGIELSGLEKDNNGKNHQVHILAQGINPFDTKLNNVLSQRVDKDVPFYKSIGSIEEIVSMFDNQPNCIMGFAHPMKDISHKLNSEEKENLVLSLVDKFRELAKGRSAYIENYYQSYKNAYERNDELIEKIKEYSDETGLLSSGGYDTHGKSIFTH